MKNIDDDYCPIKTQDKACGAGGECNHYFCWEKMHRMKIPDGYQKKIEHWAETKRGDENRWKKAKC